MPRRLLWMPGCHLWMPGCHLSPRYGNIGQGSDGGVCCGGTQSTTVVMKVAAADGCTTAATQSGCATRAVHQLSTGKSPFPARSCCATAGAVQVDIVAAMASYRRRPRLRAVGPCKWRPLSIESSTRLCRCLPRYILQRFYCGRAARDDMCCLLTFPDPDRLQVLQDQVAYRYPLMGILFTPLLPFHYPRPQPSASAQAPVHRIPHPPCPAETTSATRARANTCAPSRRLSPWVRTF